MITYVPFLIYIKLTLLALRRPRHRPEGRHHTRALLLNEINNNWGVAC